MKLEKSRAQRRRDDQPRHDLAQKLVSMSAAALARLPLEEQVREAVAFAASRTQHGARRREIRHLATILRSLDDETFSALEAAADALYSPASGSGSRFDAAVEQWADDLIAEEPGSLERIHGRFPDLDLTRLRQLVRNCRTSQPKSSSPALPGTESAPGSTGRADSTRGIEEPSAFQIRSRARLLRYLSDLMDADRGERR